MVVSPVAAIHVNCRPPSRPGRAVGARCAVPAQHDPRRGSALCQEEPPRAPGAHARVEHDEQDAVALDDRGGEERSVGQGGQAAGHARQTVGEILNEPLPRHGALDQHPLTVDAHEHRVAAGARRAMRLANRRPPRGAEVGTAQGGGGPGGRGRRRGGDRSRRRRGGRGSGAAGGGRRGRGDESGPAEVGPPHDARHGEHGRGRGEHQASGAASRGHLLGEDRRQQRLAGGGVLGVKAGAGSSVRRRPSFIETPPRGQGRPNRGCRAARRACGGRAPAGPGRQQH